ncbi:MerR family transcriptional regulator [Pseudonocardia alaniniphila]|uniref:MerR family transcriptional regulator n=1 Tax=Pseudonocardia alaniniphila TaxID=75291 RepID=A0ABS9TTB7_9PSEU|nr:MerR family transcriptional regulator [Pseudonocardia alaniniphila]MCH6171813.1 MerR family transcriptional regulator [Pseudonocardia alaniniphila]
MSWSTRELAELAGTTLRAVRHYHDLGLLPEPERRANGYKQYGVRDLVRLLRITRLVGLGFSLAQIAAMDEDEHPPAEALRAIDAELAATIDRLHRVRLELGLILSNHTPVDLPSEVGLAADGVALSDADRALVAVMTRVMGAHRLAAYTDLLRSVPTDPTDAEFDALPADADPAARQDLAARMLPYIRRIRAEHPLVMTRATGARGEERRVVETAAAVMAEFYNPAQRDVIRRVSALLWDE